MRRALVSACFCAQPARLSWYRFASSANVRCCTSSTSPRRPPPLPSESAKPVSRSAQNATKQEPLYWRYRGAEKPAGAPSEHLVVREECVRALADILMYSFDGERERGLLIESMLHKSCVGSTVEIEESGEVLNVLSSNQCNGKEYCVCI